MGLMSPFTRFLAGLHSIRADFDAEMEELLAFAEVMARKENTLELDENGSFYVSATGTLEEVIETLEKQLQKLKRIKQQKDGNN